MALRLAQADNGDTLLERDEPVPQRQVTDHHANLAKVFPGSLLDTICSSLLTAIDNDERSRSDWFKIAEDAYKLLGVGPESRDTDSDDENEDTSDHTLMLTALTRFQSKALAAVLPSSVRVCIAEPVIDPMSIQDEAARDHYEAEIAEVSKRVEGFYTYYLLKKVKGYAADTDQIIFECGLQGQGIRKIIKDPSRKQRPVNLIHVSAANIILSYDAKNFVTGRVTHRIDMPTSELVRMIATRQYLPHKNLSPQAPEQNQLTEAIDRMVGLDSTDGGSSEIHRIFECHCDLIIKEDMHPLGISRPYVVTIHSTANEILSIQRNWREGDVDEDRIQHFVGWPYSPGKTATTPLGLGHLLSNTTRALRKGQRAGLDAGYLQNHPSGFKLSSFKIRDDGTKVKIGDFVDIDSPTDDIRRALMMHTFEGPSAGLMTLMDKIEAGGKELGGIATLDFAEMMKAGVTAAPAMAAIEESNVFQTAIQRRLYTAQETEFDLLHTLMKEAVGNQAIQFGDQGQLHPGDLMQVRIKPVMKPGSASRQRDVLEAQAVFEMANAAPDVIDKREATIGYLRSLGNPQLEQALLPPPDENPPQPMDILTEYTNVLSGKPIAAGMLQDHAAHIMAHSAQMKGLQASELPPERAMAAMSVLADHIAQHMSLDMASKVAAQLGVPPDQFTKGIPPQIENQISGAMAKVVAEVEAARIEAVGTDTDTRIEVEQMKQAGQNEREASKQAHDKEIEAIKAAHALEMQKLKDENMAEREEMDNDAAIEVAAMRNTIRSNATAGVDASAGVGRGTGVRASAGSGRTP